MSKKLLAVLLCLSFYGTGHAQWTLSNTGINTFYDLRTVHFPTATVGYTGGVYAFYKTTNGGAFWTDMLSAIPASYRSIQSIHFINKDTGFISGWSSLNSSNAPINGFILRTVNGGTSWTVVKSAAAGPVNSVKFVSPSMGFAAGASTDGASNVFGTTDGGVTWTTISTLPGMNIEIFDMTATPNGTVFMCGMLKKSSFDFYEILFRKQAGSSTIDTVTFTAPTFCTFYRGIRALNNNEVFAVGNKCFAKTANSGTTWTTSVLNNANPNGGSFECVAFTSNLNGWAGGDGGDFYKTTDGGTTWSAVVLGTGSFLYDIFFLNATTGFVVGNDGVIYKYTGGSTNSVASSTQLHDLRIFPNPAFARFTVEGVNENYTAALLSMNGQVMSTQSLTPTAPTMDCSALPQGLYFVVLRDKAGAQVFTEKVLVTE